MALPPLCPRKRNSVNEQSDFKPAEFGVETDRLLDAQVPLVSRATSVMKRLVSSYDGTVVPARQVLKIEFNEKLQTTGSECAVTTLAVVPARQILKIALDEKLQPTNCEPVTTILENRREEKVQPKHSTRKQLRFNDLVTVVVIPMDKASIESRKSFNYLRERFLAKVGWPTLDFHEESQENESQFFDEHPWEADSLFSY